MILPRCRRLVDVRSRIKLHTWAAWSTKLDTTIAQTIKGIATSDKNVGYVELRNAYIGHRWCDADPWAYGISIITHDFDINNQAPFHPTPAGQQVIASYVTPAVQELLKPSK